MFCQEHKLNGLPILEAKLWAKRNGWSSYWNEAEGEAIGRSGGVAVFVRSYVQSWVHPDVDPHFFASRGIGICVSAGGLGPILCISCYFFTNNTAKTKIHPANMRMLGVLGNFISKSNMPVLIGADWNMEPQLINSSMLLENFNLHIRTTKGQLQGSMGTCVTGGGAHVSTIDYFALSNCINDVVDQVQLHNDIAPRPHRPVLLSFLTTPKAFAVKVIREPKKLPTAPPFGPVFPPRDWSPFAHDISGPLERLECRKPTPHYKEFPGDQKEVASNALEKAMTCWCNRAEEDLLDILGYELKANNRGNASPNTSVNTINTYKFPAGVRHQHPKP